MTPHVLILLENQGYPGDVRVRRHAETLALEDYEVTVLCPRAVGERADEVFGGVRILRYPLKAGARGALGYLTEYAAAAVGLGRLMMRVRGQDPIDVVIACNPPDFLVMLARLLAPRGTTVVFDHHDLSPELYERKFGRRGLMHRLLLALEWLAFHAAHLVIVPNDSYAEVAHGRGGVAPSRLFLVRHAPDPRRIYEVPPRSELRRGRPLLVVWAGGITAAERVLPLIEAADELVNLRGRRDVVFAIIGDGDGREELLEDVKHRGLEGVVELPGWAGDELLRAYYSTADVCVSVDRRNEMNERSTVTKVLDYMAIGKPIVQFPLREMHGICGDAAVYARDGDCSDLADQIAALLDDPQRRERLAEASRSRMLDGRMWPDQVASLREVMETALARGKAT